MKELARLVSLSILVYTVSSFNNIFNLQKKFHELPIEKLSYADEDKVETKWFEQTFDHFGSGPEANSTFKQKYFYTNQFEKEDGPIFLMIGGEGPAAKQLMTGWSWTTYAKKYGAAQFQLEHRYYGDSNPTKDLSTENLKYLSSEQALADLANFIRSMNKEMKLEGRKWITFGGSYSGSLSLWARAKYPDVVSGAISSSGPVLAKVDFWEYLGVVNNDFIQTQKGCMEAVSEAMYEAKILLDLGPFGWDLMDKKLNLCGKFDGSKKLDVYTLFGTLMGSFFGTAQYGTPAGKNSSMAQVCNDMTRDTSKTPLARLNQILQQGGQCVSFDYEKSLTVIKDIKNGNYYRTWIYQTCNEFGWYQTSNMPHHPYTNLFPVEMSLKMCEDVYGSKFTSKNIYENADKTNQHYGGKSPSNVTNVVIVHGTFDPWHAMGILKPLNPTVPVVISEGTSHCYNMHTPKPSDPPGIKKARNVIRANIAKWLKE